MVSNPPGPHTSVHLAHVHVKEPEISERVTNEEVMGRRLRGHYGFSLIFPRLIRENPYYPRNPQPM